MLAIKIQMGQQIRRGTAGDQTRHRCFLFRGEGLISQCDRTSLRMYATADDRLISVIGKWLD
jgi:hypothetical protein